MSLYLAPLVIEYQFVRQLAAIKNNNSDNNNTNNNNNNNSGTMRRTTPVTFALMSVRSPYTEEHCKRKLKEFLDFIGLPVNLLDEEGRAFLARAKVENINNNDINASNEYRV